MRPRRRNRAVHQAILTAAVELLESEGYRSLTIERIAERAKVGKQTIYRWWPNKAALVMEAFAAAGERRVPLPDTGTLSGDLEAILVPVFAQNADYAAGIAQANKGMMSEAQIDPAFRETYLALHRSWWAPLLVALERGQARGELRHDADCQALVDLMLGASWYRVLLEHAPLDAQFARLLVRSVVEGNRPDSSSLYPTSD